jgi:hypothetical protein
MRVRPFVAALLLPLVITAATLALVAWNRSGGRGPIVLSDREVYTTLSNDEDTTATLWLTWKPEGRGSAGEVTSKPELRQGFAALALNESAPADRSSRLEVVDIDRDAATLERRYPDGRTHIISAATINVPADGAYEKGWVVSLEPMRLQVPREWAGQLAARSFDVELWYGLRYEPWISAIRRR